MRVDQTLAKCDLGAQFNAGRSELAPVKKTILLFALLLLAALVYRAPDLSSSLDAVGRTATALVRPVAVPVVHLIAAPAFVYITSILILVAGFAVSVAYYRRAVRPQIRRLRSLRDRIMELPLPHGPERARASEAMHKLGSTLRELNLFPIAWAAFQVEATREIRIPGAPFSFFALSDPTANHAERRGFMQALPSYFTSVGLILTFLGLVVALYAAARGFQSGSLEEARASILQLLNASSFKFLTSVAALTSALLVSLVLRVSQSNIRQESELTIGTIESYISAWRERQAPHDELRHPSEDILERLDALIIGVGTLSRTIEKAMAQREPRRTEVVHNEPE